MEQTLYCYWEQCTWEDHGQVKCFTAKRSYESGDWVYLGEHYATIPDFKEPTHEEKTLHRIEVLMHEKQKLLADTHVELQVIEQAIQELQAITYQPEAQID